MSIKILLADDSITIQKVIGIIFGGSDYSLTVVDNGRAAIAKARETSPDILLVDALMPGMSGYEVCEQVRAMPELKATPILLLTGSFEPFDEEKARRCGADDFIAKPFESQQIIAKVRELCELGASRAAAAFEPAPEPASDAMAAVSPSEPFETSAPDDIWGAFMAPEPESAPAPAPPSPAPAVSEPDVFALVNEGPEALQWGPVGEHTFEFTDEPADGSPFAAVPEPPAPVADAFGDITFDEPLAPSVKEEPAAPVFGELGQPSEAFSFGETFFGETAAQKTPESSQTGPVTPAPAEPAAQDVFAPSPSMEPPPAAEPGVTLSEEQLKAALAGLSREVIERVVWEVVPDLAEALIKEAIRKIREDR